MVKTPTYRCLSAFFLLSFFAACSGSAKITQGNDASASVFQPNNLTTASAQISAASGGYINVGSAQLRIPAQALDSDTTITAEVADISLPAGSAKAVGKGIRLKPEGLQFLNPAELEICYSGAEAAALNESNAQIYYHTEDNQYVAIAGTVDVNRHCVKSHIEHFSSYVAAAVAQVPGNTAPVIGGANFLPATPMAGIPLRVRTAITDVNGGAVPGQVVSAFLYYRTVGAPSFTKVALQPDDTDDTVTNRYYYQIPASAVTLAGIEYYFEATDNLNLLRRLPAAAGTFSTRTVPTSATALRFNPVGDLQISAGFMRALTLQAFDGTAWQNISVDNSVLTNVALGSLLRTGPSTVRFSAVGAGAGQITSTIASLTTATNINVVPGLLTHIEITDVNQVILTGTANLPAGQIYNFDVIGFDTYGNVATILPLITTTGSIGTISTDLTGAHLAAAASAGSGSIVADIAGFTDTLNVNIYMPPQVTATAPFDNTSGIALNASIGVSFSHVMNTSTLTATTTSACTGSLQVSADNFATCVAMASATPAFYASNTLAVIQPAVNLAGLTTYKIRVTTGASDTAGYPLAATYTTPAGFTTVAAPVSGCLPPAMTVISNGAPAFGLKLMTDGSIVYAIRSEFGSPTSRIVLDKWNCTSWEFLGQVTSANPIINAEGLMYNGFPAIAYTAEEFSARNIRVYRWDGTQMVQLPSPMRFPTSTSAGQIDIEANGTTLYAVWQESVNSGGFQIFASSWDGAAWTPLGSQLNIGANGYFPKLAIFQGDLFASVVDDVAGKSVFLHRYTGSWNSVGGNLVADPVNTTQVYSTDLVAGPTAVYGAWAANDSTGDGKVYVVSFDGATTAVLGGAAVNASAANGGNAVTLGLMGGIPYLGYMEQIAPASQAYALYFSSGSWNIITGGSLNVNPANNAASVIFSQINGTKYYAFSESAGSVFSSPTSLYLRILP